MQCGPAGPGAGGDPAFEPRVHRGDPDAAPEAGPQSAATAEELQAALRMLELATGRRTDAMPRATDSGFGRLAIRGRIGGGGMATVYRAHDPVLRRDVALKLMPASLANVPGVVARFRREAIALARIRHPHIVAIHDAGENDGALWFTMDLVEGGSLHEILARHSGSDPTALQAADLRPVPADPPPPDANGPGSYAEAVARMFVKLAEALDYAHREGLVHRDVKPANVMVDRAGEPHLVDFGIARGEDAATVTRTGIGPGTPAYMAPEQISGLHPIGPRTDVYGLGITLYEALTLQRPFTGDTAERVFHAVLTADPAPPRRWNPQIPRDLETICLTAIEKDPARRYASADALAVDLRSLLNLRPIHARPAGPATRLRRWLRRHPLPAAIALAVVLVCTAIGAYALVAAAGRRADLRADLAAGRDALAFGDLDAAERWAAMAAGIDPEHAELRALRTAISAAHAARGHARELAEARAKLAAYERSVAAIVHSRAQIEALRERVLYALPPMPDPQQWPREQQRLQTLLVEAELHMLAANDAFSRAERFVAGTAGVRIGLADLYMARWRAAVGDGDSPIADAYLAKVEEYDLERRHHVELAGEATLTVTGTPAGAELHLFRYELHSRLRSGGDQRLVPAPFDVRRGRICEPAREAAPAAGDVALAVLAVTADSAASAAGLRPRDLITRIGGIDAGEALFVRAVAPGGAAARAGIARLDRLVRFARRDVDRESDLESIYSALAPGTPYEVVLASGGGERRVGAVRGSGWQSDLGVSFAPAAEALPGPVPPAGLQLEVVTNGATRGLTLAAGAELDAELLATAYPLLFTPANRLAPLPLHDLRLPPGSYLLVAGAPDHEDLRLPLDLPRAARVTAQIDLLRAGSTPPGFVHVPPGPSDCGGDPEASGARLRQRVDLPGFFLARAEVTAAEYAEFLDDPSTRAAIAAAAERGMSILVPRDVDGGPRWLHGADGRHMPDCDPRSPVHDIAAVDADAYAAWRSARAQARREPWTYALPTAEQWEKAARGADRRWYPWGNAFDWSFCNGWQSGDPMRCEPSLRFLTDESPFGIRDLAGGVLEWMARDSNDGTRRQWRGGAWQTGDLRPFRAASVHEGDPGRVGRNDGFRLVATPAVRPAGAAGARAR